MLLCIDLFFFCAIEAYEKKTDTLSVDVIESTCSILENRGVFVRPETVYSSLESYDIIRYENRESVLRSAAYNFVSRDCAVFSLPGGKAFFSDEVYFEIKENSEFMYRDTGEFPIVIDSPSQDLTHDSAEDIYEFAEQILKGVTSGEKLMNDRHVLKLLKDVVLDPSDAPLLNDITFTERFGYGVYSFYLGVQRINGLTVSENRVAVCVKDEKVVLIKGTYVFGEVEEKHNTDFYDGANILFFLANDSGTVSDMQLVYRGVFYSESGFYLVPTYRICFEDGRVLFADAVSGYVREGI
ncbi:MAG: hypothetical protein E7665_02795 [Ruminococcaceae bacterium]|nr:hypothetical protein [Oscillospiraceae bacterium]